MSSLIFSGRAGGSLQWRVYVYLQPIIVISGLLGNMLSIVLMRSKEMRKLTFSCYLTGLAVTDSLALIHFGAEWLDDLLPSSLFMFRISSHSACLVYPFLVRGCYLTSAWLMVAFTIDRAFSVCCPFSAHKHLTQPKSLLVTLIIPVVCLLSQIYHPILFPKSGDYCGEVFALPRTLATGILTANEVMVVLSRTVLLLNLPFIIILATNVAVVVAVRQRITILKTLAHNPALNSDSGQLRRRRLAFFKKETTMSLKLLSVSMSFFILLLPDAVVLIQDVYRVMAGTMDWFLYGNSYRSVCRMIFTCNFAVNFLFYSFAFRKQMPKIRKKRVVNPVQIITLH